MIAYLQFPKWISPEIIPGLPLRWYGLMYLVAFVITYLLFRYQIRNRELNVEDEDVINMFFWGILGLLLGARIFAALIYDPTGRYLQNPLLIFWPFDSSMRFTGLQGMSYHGGLIGAIVGVSIYTKVKKINFLDWADMLVAGIPLGYTFGRLGNFINGELYGRVTTAAWGMIFPEAQRFSTERAWVRNAAEEVGISFERGDLVNLPRHPSQLYEAFFEGIFLWAFLWFFIRKKKHYNGFVLGWYIIGYGVVRFFIEYVRQPDKGIGFPLSLGALENPDYLLLTPWNFTTGQILCFIMILGGGLFLFIRHMQTKNDKHEGEKDRKKVSSRKLRKKIK
jgi:phosphatidylglycerol---prolipoprotein diacylglyceryl transferase